MNAPGPLDGDGAIVYRYAHATHRGMVREQNEDAIAIAPRSGLAIVADGMGGYNAGEVASRLAADFLMTHLVEDLAQLRDGAARSTAGPDHSHRMLHALLRARIDGANEAIIDAASREPECEGMGTTLAMLLFSQDAATTLHLGDSRIYRFRNGVLSLLTRDHSLLQEQIDSGLITAEQAAFSSNKNLVTRAVGVEDTVLLETHLHDVMPGDVYLLCSDGLSDMIDDETISQLLQSCELLPEAANALVDAANEAGGKDNISVVLVRVRGPAGAARSWWPFRR